jgi:hypothetical protein
MVCHSSCVTRRITELRNRRSGVRISQGALTISPFLAVFRCNQAGNGVSASGTGAARRRASHDLSGDSWSQIGRITSQLARCMTRDLADHDLLRVRGLPVGDVLSRWPDQGLKMQGVARHRLSHCLCPREQARRPFTAGPCAVARVPPRSSGRGSGSSTRMSPRGFRASRPAGRRGRRTGLDSLRSHRSRSGPSYVPR